MTPSGWSLDSIGTLGVLWLFGGCILAIGVGAVVGRYRSPMAGAISGLLLWGLPTLVVALWAVLYVHVDTRVLMLLPSRCEPLPAAAGQPQRQVFLALQPQGQVRREVSTPTAKGMCREDAVAAPEPVRVRLDAIASSQAVITGEFVDRRNKPLAIIVMMSVFGGAPVLIALVLLATTTGGSKSTKPATTPKNVAPWRSWFGSLCGQLGGLVFLAAFIVPFFLEGSIERGFEFGLRALASALALWFVGGISAATLTRGGAAGLLVFVGVLLGVSELIKHSG